MESRGLSTLPIFISIILMLMAVMATTFLPGYVNPTAFDIFTTPSCGSTVTDNLTFDADLDCSGIGGNGLIIGEDNITLDCAGFSIIGQGSGLGVYNNGFDNVTIKNCNISLFDIGIYCINESDYSTLYNNTANDNLYGIYVQVSLFNNLTDNTANNNTDAGIFAHSIQNSTFTNNTVNNSSAYGILIGDSIYVTCVNNTAEYNQHGVIIDGGGSNNLINNTADNNHQIGIGVYSGTDNLFANNTMSNNAWNFYIPSEPTNPVLNQIIDTSNLVDGKPIYYYKNNDSVGTVPSDAGMVIAIDSSGLIAQDLIMSNNSQGILLRNTSGSIISNNTIGNMQYGIDLMNSNNSNLTSNTIYNSWTAGIETYNLNNTIIYNNTITDSDEGISISSSYANLTENSISYNRVGIYASGPDNTFYNNTVNDNTGWGVYLAGGDIRNNNLSSNIMYGNYRNFILWGSGYAFNYEQTIDTSNLVDGKPIYYYKNNDSVGTVPSDAGMVIAVHSSNLNISGLTMQHNGYGILMFNTTNSFIQGNNLEFNQNGLWIVFNSNNNTFINNIADNDEEGISIYDSNNNTLINNTASSNMGDGLDIENSNNNTITNITADNNRYDGIVIYSCNYNNFTYGSLKNNMYGIYMEDSNSNNFTSITANDNFYNDSEGDGGYGIYIAISNNNTFYNNTANNNTFGFYSNHNIYNNFINNTANYNYYDSLAGWGGYGLYFDYNSSTNNITYNTFCSNDVNDAYFSSDSTDNSGSNDCIGIEDYDSNTPAFSCSGSCPATPITGCMNLTTVGETYVLTSDLTDTQPGLDTCIGVQADYVTLDCAGRNITKVSSGDYAINVSGHTNVTIKNCIIAGGYLYGIYFAGSDFGTIQNNTVSYSVFGISADGYNNTLIDNTATDSQYDSGLGYGGFGINIGGANNTLINNTANDNLFGIEIGRSDLNTLINNTANNNYYDSVNGDGGYGFIVSGYNNTLINNTANDNPYGFLLFSNYTNMSFNTANNNYYDSDMGDGGYGMYFNRAGHYNIINNTADNNEDTGIYLTALSTNNILIDNKACDNLNNAFRFSSDSTDNSGDNFCPVGSIDDQDGNTVTCTRDCPYIFTQGVCNQNVQGDVNLTQDLNCTTSGDDGMYVGTDYVTIDCDGHSIFTPGHTSGLQTGISVSSSNVTIKNCFIMGFVDGIYFSGAQNGTIFNNTLFDNVVGIMVDLGSNNTVLSHNNFTSNPDNGIWFDGVSNNEISSNTVTASSLGGLFATDGENNKIFNNTVRLTASDGLMVSGEHNSIYNNTARDNDGNGIVAEYCNSSTISNNTLINNSVSGLDVIRSSNDTISNNTAETNLYGIRLEFSDLNILINNTLNNNSFGLYLGGSNNTIYNNTANNNYYSIDEGDGGYGFFIDGSVPFDTLYNNLTNNTANDNEYYGFYLVDSSYNNFTHNTANINGDTGFQVTDSVNNTLVGNIVCDNGNNAFYFDMSSTDNSGDNFCDRGKIADDDSNTVTCTISCSVVGPFCGNSVCETGETTANCPADCPAPIMPGGGLPPPTPPPEQPPAAPQPPPTAPETWPPEIQPPAPGEVITIPQTGTTILISGMLINGTPTDGTVAILLYPGASNTATIHNISAIMPEKLTCGQIALAGYEINITADTINYCMNYRGKLGNVSESSLSVWKFSEGRWTQLPSDNVLHDTNIICGNVTSAMTPYMIAGFVPVIGITPELAMTDIQNAQAIVFQAETEGKDVTLAKSLLEQAQAAFDGCDFAGAKQLADNAIAACQGLNVENIIWAFLIIAAAVAAYLSYKRLRKKVKPRASKK